MNFKYLKYSLLLVLSLCNILLLIAQQPISDRHNVFTIIGDSIPINNIDSKSIYQSKSESKSKSKSLVGSENSLNSFDNEFRLPTELKPTTKDEVSVGSLSNNKEYGKVKKRKTSLTEMKFNIKKRFRTWIPKRKKKYRPTICGKI